MKYCSNCGEQSIERRIPQEDTFERDICVSCNIVFYTNPNIVTGAIITFNNKVLLCKRAIEPRLGYWTYPAGFLENYESPEAGAVRETQEESRIEINITDLLGIYTIKRANQIHMVFKAEPNTYDYGVTSESSEVRLFAIDEIPWADLAFPVVKQALSYYLAVKDQKDIKTQRVVICSPIDNV